MRKLDCTYERATKPEKSEDADGHERSDAREAYAAYMGRKWRRYS